MKKRGFLLAEETLKIIVAVICIGILVFLLVSIYNNKLNNEKKKYAEGTLGRTKEIIFSLNNGESSIQDLVNPEGWYLIGFVGEEAKPNLCLGKNCACICPNAWDYYDKFKRQAKKCDEDGACLIIEELKDFNRIKIVGTENIIFIRIKKENNFIFIGG